MPMGRHTLEYLKVKEAAAILGVSSRTIRRWIRDHKLHAVRINNLVRIPKESIAQLIRPIEVAK